MTEKLNNIIFITFITVLTLAAAIFGFLAIPSPDDQRKIELDQKRVSDLGQIQYTIDNYY